MSELQLLIIQHGCLPEFHHTLYLGLSLPRYPNPCTTSKSHNYRPYRINYGDTHEERPNYLNPSGNETHITQPPALNCNTILTAKIRNNCLPNPRPTSLAPVHDLINHPHTRCIEHSVSKFYQSKYPIQASYTTSRTLVFLSLPESQNQCTL